jgi:hypothetical protein
MGVESKTKALRKALRVLDKATQTHDAGGDTVHAIFAKAKAAFAGLPRPSRALRFYPKSSRKAMERALKS